MLFLVTMVNISTYIDFDVENNDKDPKLKVGDCVLISKYKTIFAKGYNPILLEELFVINKVKKHCTIDICNRRP